MPSPPSDFPPSTNSVWPVMKLVLSEAKNAIALAISSGFAAAPPGSSATAEAYWSAGILRDIGVSVNPGAIEFTAIFFARYSMTSIDG